MSPFGYVLPLLLCLAGVCEMTHGRGRGRGSKWWGIAKAGEPSNLMSNSIRSSSGADTYLDPAIHGTLRRKQRRLVRENPGVIVAIAKGAKIAVHECKHQFQHRRWNCSTRDFLRGKNLFGKIVDRACRESAFVYALTSAAVTHTVSRACSEGSMETCDCDYRNHGPSGLDWEWGGCSDNIEFGYKFSRLFVDAGEKGRDMRFMMNLHNNEVGRAHLSSGMRQECKCHGMSGSCTVQTCWMRLPQFRAIGDSLKDRFDGASRILVSNVGNLRTYGRGRGRYNFRLKPYNPNHKPPSRKDLVYYETSPDFCERTPKLGIHGTRGRQCNDTSIGVDGCDLMCCGRGHRTQVKEVLERCSCTFQWCCEVKCKVCRTKKTIHTCL